MVMDDEGARIKIRLRNSQSPKAQLEGQCLFRKMLYIEVILNKLARASDRLSDASWAEFRPKHPLH
jgi:hypothetical protein